MSENLTIEITSGDKLIHYTVISNAGQLDSDEQVLSPLVMEVGREYTVKHNRMLGKGAVKFEMAVEGMALVFYPDRVAIQHKDSDHD